MNEEIQAQIEQLTTMFAKFLFDKIPPIRIETVPTKFNIGAKVFLYIKGKLTEHEIQEINSILSKTGSKTRYGFYFSMQPDASAVWLTEDEIFASKEEILTR